VDHPNLSVVTWGFLSGSLIREAFDSVLAQTFQDFLKHCFRRMEAFKIEETDFYLRIWNLGSFYLIPESLIAFRLPSPEFLKKTLRKY